MRRNKQDEPEAPMTNQIAIALLLLFAAFLVADHFWLQLDVPMFLARELDRFIEYLSFWR
jgi:hypothetical protein